MKKIIILIFAGLLFSLVATCQSEKIKTPQGKEAPPNGPKSVNEIFVEMDANKDGKLALKELKGPLKDDFSKIDSNKDGFISKKELQKAPKPERKGPPPNKDQKGPPPAKD